MKKQTLIIVVLLYFLSATFFTPPAVALTPHEGDGQFKDISFWSWGRLFRGYTITFDEFDLGSEQKRKYQIEDLPRLKNGTVVYLFVPDPDNKWQVETIRTLTGSLAIQLRNSHGEVLRSTEEPISKLWWSTHGGGHALYSDREIRDPAFVPQKGEGYEIDITYSGDPKLKGAKGYVFIRCGGSK